MPTLLRREVCQILADQSQYPWDLASGMKDSVSRCVSSAREYADPVQLYRAWHVSLTYSLQADKIEKLEKDHGWNEEQFDFILQFLRTILLKREPSSITSRVDFNMKQTAHRSFTPHLSLPTPSRV